MDAIEIHVPAMYGDHHVLAVRQLLLGLPGIAEVNASSCFQTVVVTFDPGLTDGAAITAALETAGYLQPMAMPVESGEPTYGRANNGGYIRRTVSHAQTAHVVQFKQQVAYSGRPLWPCPGMGPISRNEDVDNG